MIYIFNFAVPDKEFVNTSWVNHFDTQDTDSGNLDNELYQVKTVGRNPLGESPPSDITETKPLCGVAGMFTPLSPLQKYTCLLSSVDIVFFEVPNQLRVVQHSVLIQVIQQVPYLPFPWGKKGKTTFFQVTRVDCFDP